MVYLIAKNLFNKKCVLIAGLLASLNPMLIAYSQHLRNYSLLIFLFLAALYFFILYIKENKKIFLALTIVFNSLMVYTHYQGVIAVSTFFFFITAEKFLWKNKINMKESLTAILVPALLFVPMGLIALSNIKTVATTFGNASLENFFYIFYKYFVGLNIGYLIKENFILLLAFPFCIILLGIGIIKMHKENKLILSFIGIPILASFLVSMIFPHFFHFRYLVYVLPLMLVAISFAIDKIENRIFKGALILSIALLWLFTVFSYYSLTIVENWGIFFGL